MKTWLAVVAFGCSLACGSEEGVPPAAGQADSPGAAAARVSETALAAHFLRIRIASDRFRAVNGAYPGDVSELVNGGFIHAGQEKDPWGNPYLLRVDGAELVILSLGADGRPGGEEHNRDRVSNGVPDLR